MNEQSKAAKRRFYDGSFHARFFAGDGIDIGGKPDPLIRYIGLFSGMKSVKTWDIEDGDAQFLIDVKDESYDFLMASHSLEHMVDVTESLRNWLRIVKPGGYQIITVPDEDLYEQGYWPSKWNGDHKHTFTIYKKKSWSPVSINILDLVIDLGLKVERIVLVNDFYLEEFRGRDQTTMPVAECSIEFIIKKEME